MPSHRITARPPREPLSEPRILRGEDLADYLQDAARTPGGHAPAVALPEHEGHIAWLLRDLPTPFLPVGARSSLTGGATPFGETVISTERLDGCALVEGAAIVGAGLPLLTLLPRLEAERRLYPPVPTFDGAFAGGVAATNAAGAQTFKYGVTRDWVDGLTVVLACGEVLDLRRGETIAADGRFVIETSQGELSVPVPSYRPPDVAKCSAGYHSDDALDLVDLFIGAEGTLGVITELRLRTIDRDFERLWGFLTLPGEAEALELTRRLREASQETWATGRAGVDIAAIESLDARSLELLRGDEIARSLGVELPEARRAALLFQMEVRGDPEAVADEMAAFFEGEVEAPTPVTELCAILAEFDALEHLELALPGDERRAEQLFKLRDRVPTIVNHLVADAQREVDGRIHKTAADMIVPWERLAESLTLTRALFEREGLDIAVWGHISDGNLHPNVIPRSFDEVTRGKAVIVELGEAFVGLGGSPLAEHGVGRNPMKHALLRQLYGEAGIAEMRRVKAALDPDGRLAPGVLWPAPAGD